MSMTAIRERLPDRRPSRTFSFECAGMAYTATASWFEDGRLGEVFVGNHKSNSQADSNAKDAAIIASLCLQHGISLDTIRKSLLRDSQGRPSTPVAMALDILARESTR